MEKGHNITVRIYEVTDNFPKQEVYSLTSQLRRATLSIPSNIAEGSSRASEKENRRYMEIALGSCFELETQLLISQAACYGSAELISSLLQDVIEEQKMLTGFISRLQS